MTSLPSGADLVDASFNRPYVSSNFIYVHIPKTGGKWVAKNGHICGWWERKGDGHLPPCLIDSEIRQGRYTVGFVRHPVDWLKSWHAYHKEVRVKDDPTTLGRLKSRFYTRLHLHGEDVIRNLNWMELDLTCFYLPDFSDFVERVTALVPNYWSILLDFYLPGLDYPGKQECLKVHLAGILRSIGERRKAAQVEQWGKPVNNSKGSELEISDSHRERIMQANKYYVERFGYED